MIDDFQVPDDSGYGYDDYGSGATLSRDYLLWWAWKDGTSAIQRCCHNLRPAGSEAAAHFIAGHESSPSTLTNAETL